MGGAREEYDAVVAGLGVMGRAACRELADRGRSVLGLDRRGPSHRLGSSHGESRLIRALYHEGSKYVPLLERARSGWRELEDEAGEELLLRIGGLLVGPPDGALLSGCRSTAADRGLPYEELDAGEVVRRFPAFRVPAGHRALLDPGAGVLRADRCLRALRRSAERSGAELRFGDGVRGWARRQGRVAVEAGSGAATARSLLLAAGAWTAELVGDPGLPLTVERQTVHHFRPGDGAPYGPGRFPVFMLEGDDGAVAYGAPDLGSGVKVALHYGGERGRRPEEVRRPATREDGRKARRAVEELLPGLPAEPSTSRACLYTNTPDRDFVIGRLGAPAGRGARGSRDGPGEAARAAVAAGFSGHGFKFAPAVAEAVADLLGGEAPGLDLAPFRPGRWED